MNFVLWYASLALIRFIPEWEYFAVAILIDHCLGAAADIHRRRL